MFIMTYSAFFNCSIAYRLLTALGLMRSFKNSWVYVHSTVCDLVSYLKFGTLSCWGWRSLMSCLPRLSAQIPLALLHLYFHDILQEDASERIKYNKQVILFIQEMLSYSKNIFTTVTVPQKYSYSIFTHITHVGGIQLRASGSSAAYDVLRLLQMEAAGVKSFIQLPDVSLQWSSVTCRGTQSTYQCRNSRKLLWVASVHWTALYFSGLMQYMIKRWTSQHCFLISQTY